MEARTNMEMIRELLIDYPWFRKFLITNYENGNFIRILLDSKMFPKNKIFCLKYLNKLVNGFYEPNSLKKWV